MAPSRRTTGRRCRAASVDTTDRLLDLLDRAGIRATFFVLGYVAERHPQLIERIAQAGHEIGSHGHMHDARVRTDRRLVSKRIWTGASRRSRRAAYRPVDGFRAPEWSINERSLWALDVLARKGFRFDSSMAPMRIVGNPATRRHRIGARPADGAIVEFPPAVVHAVRHARCRSAAAGGCG